MGLGSVSMLMILLAGAVAVVVLVVVVLVALLFMSGRKDELEQGGKTETLSGLPLRTSSYPARIRTWTKGTKVYRVGVVSHF